MKSWNEDTSLIAFHNHKLRPSYFHRDLEATLEIAQRAYPTWDVGQVTTTAKQKVLTMLEPEHTMKVQQELGKHERLARQRGRPGPDWIDFTHVVMKLRGSTPKNPRHSIYLITSDEQDDPATHSELIKLQQQVDELQHKPRSDILELKRLIQDL